MSAPIRTLLPVFCLFLAILSAPAYCEDVTIPDLVNDPASSAQRALGRAGLIVGDVINEPSDTIEIGNVIRTDPAGGTVVPENTVVDLYISSGPENPILVPNVVGQAQATATSNIVAANLTVGTITEQTSVTVAAGNVISQDPQSGVTVGAGTAVDLVISSGTGQTTVPDLFELTESTAENALEDANLVLGTVSMGTSDAVLSGMVFDQLPMAGATVDENTAVNIFVSTGFTTSLAAGETLVPPLAGKPGDGAVAEAALSIFLLGWDLTLGDATFEASFAEAAGDVVRTDPPAGTVVAEGTSIDIIVSTGPDGDVPTDVNGDSAVDAVDIQLVINAALSVPSGNFDTDVNNDGNTDAVDVQLVINAVLGGSSGGPRR